ncbi:MAG: hypothetical protein IJ794_13620 [Lachnospiraceae bacterium]|nr:hypothetical protein [Lachnospiraceae bacterium]
MKKGNAFILGILASLVMVFTLIEDLPKLLRSNYDIEQEIAAGKIPQEGDYVTLGVDASVGAYVETDTKQTFSVSRSSVGYVILLEDDTVISMTVKPNMEEQMDRLVAEFWETVEAWVAGDVQKELPEKVYFSGQVEKMKSEYRSYFDKALREANISEENGFHILYIDVNTGLTARGVMLRLIIAAVSAVICFVISYMQGQAEKKALVDWTPNENLFS